MLKTKINSITLTGGATYDIITDSTIPLFKSIQFENATGASVKVKTGITDDFISLADKEIFQLDSHTPQESYGDTVKVNGTGTIKVEITYYT